MTPRRLDHDVVHARLTRIRQVLDHLESVGGVTPDRLEDDLMVAAAVERLLTVLVDLAVSINSHVASACLGRAPSDYASSFGAAAEAGALTAELAEQLAPSAGLRNVLIHQYLDVDLGQVARAVPVAVAGYRRYVSEVARFVLEQQR